MEIGPLHNASGQWRSISKFHQWMSEQKGLSPRGCRMWAHTAKCLTSCQGFPDRMQLNCTTCQITQDSARWLKPMPNSVISDPLTRLDKQIWKISPVAKPHKRPSVTQTLLLSENSAGQTSREKATLAGIMLNYLTKKILLILDRRRAYLTMLTELELCTNNLPLADRCMLNFFFFF